ncbi:MAG TPA: ribose-phosphate pyrophosphokinase [Dehalococcoidia bacterium]|nr:ribose-phosphate pyrophosphokinase [Dehalococcoidia bacterium]
MLEHINIFSGNAHPELARAICDDLGVELSNAEVFEFSNENIFVKINETVRDHDVFVVQPSCSPVSRGLWELMIMIDALKRASAGRITAVLPYYPYARTDKKDQPRVPITAKLMADFLQTAGVHRLLTMDLHAGQIQGFFNIPVDELTAFFALADEITSRPGGNRNLVVVAGDAGIAKRARNFAEWLNAPLAIIEKRRSGNLDRTEALNVIGEVRGMNALLIDDEVDTGGSLIAAAHALQRVGALEIRAACTHGVLSGPAVSRLANSPIQELIVTDTVPIPPHKRIDKLTVVPIAPVFSEAIRRIHRGDSVGEMYSYSLPKAVS